MLKFVGKMPRTTSCAAHLNSWNAHVTWTCHNYAEVYKKNAEPQDCDTRFAQACVMDTHMDMSKEPLYAKSKRNQRTRMQCT